MERLFLQLELDRVELGSIDAREEVGHKAPLHLLELHSMKFGQHHRGLGNPNTIRLQVLVTYRAATVEVDVL